MAAEGDVIQVQAEFELLGQTMMNVFYYSALTTTPDSEVLLDMQNQIEVMYDTSLMASVMVNNLQFSQITVRNFTEGLTIGILGWPSLVNGGSTGDTLPTGVAGLITASTNTPKVRGRKFIPGISEASITDSEWLTAFTDILLDFAALYIADFVGETSSNLWIAGVPTSLGAFAPFIGAVISSIPAYQRRRKVGFGT